MAAMAHPLSSAHGPRGALTALCGGAFSSIAKHLWLNFLPRTVELPAAVREAWVLAGAAAATVDRAQLCKASSCNPYVF